ncbi:MAG TPA: DUF559 domain-containing protein [Jatrophihabitans sp.]|nr:DUF559 domain-containing protein [Jatrophihabitans sp.]
MGGLPDPDWYLDNVLVHAEPGIARVPSPGPAAQWQAWWQRHAAALGSPAATQGFVVGSGQVEALGSSRQTARTAVRQGRWTAPGHGSVAPIDIRDERWFLVARRGHALACAAAVLRRPGYVVSGRSAAILHGLPTFDIPSRPELTAPQSSGAARAGPAQIRGACLDPGHTTCWFGVPVITVPWTLVDLGRHDRRDAIMALDAALREDLVTGSEVLSALDHARGWPGVRQARAVLAIGSSRAESPLESLTRLALHDDGFPPPDLQVRIPGTRFRVDMLWKQARLILEIDGLEKYSDKELRREKRRHARLRALGYRVERVTWDDIVHRWPETRAWLRSVLQLSR